MTFTKVKAQDSITLIEGENSTNYFNGKLIITRGNMLIIDMKTFSNTHFVTPPHKIEVANRNECYVFFDSVKSPIGWLIADSSRKKIFYFDKEQILVFDLKENKLKYEEQRNCGLDVFTFKSSSCGFANPSYNYLKGILYFEDKKILLPVIKRQLSL
ncbi:hypothetical protein AEM51_08465 [Bacteroidetes bacterium UKL13-3]|jgi:hypothetical protein|nr:hypothetical protein AEM51_08465 [Bacteroidetes bacterium UKL13-3]HCP92963.1 hypothetical protein [Bacteroidota bacterium]